MSDLFYSLAAADWEKCPHRLPCGKCPCEAGMWCPELDKKPKTTPKPEGYDHRAFYD